MRIVEYDPHSGDLPEPHSMPEADRRRVRRRFVGFAGRVAELIRLDHLLRHCSRALLLQSVRVLVVTCHYPSCQSRFHPCLHCYLSLTGSRGLDLQEAVNG